MALVTAEVTWLWWLLEDFGVSVSISIPLLSNNTGAISIAHDPVKHELTKQISSQRLKLTPIISFTSPNSVLLIHHEFEGGVRYILAFLLLYSFRGSLYISSLCICIYSGL
jgi:hypothetical protein